MPQTLKERAAWEAKLTAALKRTNSRYRDELRALLDRSAPTVEIDRVLASMERELQGEVAAVLLLLYMASGDRLISSLGIQVDPQLVGADAERFASDRARSFAAEHVANTRQLITTPTPADVDARDHREDVLDIALGDERAEKGAVTETTGGISRGELETGAKIEGGQGTAGGERATLAIFWRTEEDSRVCPVCSPLNNQPREVWQELFADGPPAHPRCRCELAFTRSAAA